MKCILYSRSDSNKPFEFIEEADEWPHKWEVKTLWYDVINTGRSLQLKELQKALNISMTTWDIEIPVTFKPVWFLDKPVTANITIEFKNKEQDQLFKDRPSVLAYAYFPGQGSVSGKVVFNDEYIWDLSGKGIKAKDALAKGLVDRVQDPDSIIKTWNVIHVLIHELGHSLGLKHDDDLNSDDVMDPFYNGEVLDLSPNDILRIRRKYGIRVFEHWSHYDRLKRWLKLRVRRF